MMKYPVLFCIACLFTSSAFADAGEVTSPTPIIESPNSTHTFVKDLDTVNMHPAAPVAPTLPDNLPMNTPNAPDMFINGDVKHAQRISGATGPATQMPMAGDVTPPPKASFMTTYCSPDFMSLLANNHKYFGQEECLKSIQYDACARFKHLPKDAQDIMDEAIECVFSNGNSFASEKGQRVDDEPLACAQTYVKRLDLAKRFLNDYYSLYAVLFMPDDILDTPGRCVNREVAPQPKRR